MIDESSCNFIIADDKTKINSESDSNYGLCYYLTIYWHWNGFGKF